MRAVVHDRYGPPDVLRVDELERPVPGRGQVLVRVRATTVNRTDCHRRAAAPFVWRLVAGLRRPRRQVLGSELSGEVAAIGPAEHAAEAAKYVETQQKTGNVVLIVDV